VFSYKNLRPSTDQKLKNPAHFQSLPIFLDFLKAYSTESKRPSGNFNDKGKEILRSEKCKRRKATKRTAAFQWSIAIP
jgi:hypothetical protein